MNTPTLCTGGDCPLKETCHRYTDEKIAYNWYYHEPPYRNDDCNFYVSDFVSKVIISSTIRHEKNSTHN
jgi:hypothetical protein